MSNCNKKPKHTCGDRRMNARCVFYDIDIPEYSNIHDEPCVTLEETTEDIYKLISWIKESIDLKDLKTKCLDVESIKDPYFKKERRILLKDVIQKLVDKSCSSDQDQISSSNLNIDAILQNLDYKCLVDPCGVKPGNLAQFFQMLIDKICSNGR